MSAVKILLLVGIALVGLLALRGGHGATQKAIWRIGGACVLAAAGLAVLFPESLTEMANAVGVGRGADLVLYVLAVCFLLTTAILFRRLSELEQRYVRLARRVALNATHDPGSSEQGPDAH